MDLGLGGPRNESWDSCAYVQSFWSIEAGYGTSVPVARMQGPVTLRLGLKPWRSGPGLIEAGSKTPTLVSKA